MAEFKTEMQSWIDDFKETLQSYGEDIAILKKAVLQGSASGSEAPSKVRVPEPKGFNGNRNVKELENFLWDIEQFFKAAHVPNGEKVSITSMYLTGDAKLWWRTRMEDDAESGSGLRGFLLWEAELVPEEVCKQYVCFLFWLKT